MKQMIPYISTVPEPFSFEEYNLPLRDFGESYMVQPDWHGQGPDLFAATKTKHICWQALTLPSP